MSLSPPRVFAALNAERPAGQASPIMDKAVVIGGSVAGMLAARVLSDHAERVVVLDRDDLYASGDRPGVPQGTQLHALLPGGLVQLENLFPGFRGHALRDVRTYHHADSRRRDFAALKRFPAGLVSVGDAVASFNPVYGQGMTSAALHAACLSMYLRPGPALNEPARRFFVLQKVVVDAAWSTSTAADLALPHVTGPYPRGHRLSSWVSRQIVTATITDVTIARRFNDVVSMREHPRSLATPGVVLGALRANRRVR